MAKDYRILTTRDGKFCRAVIVDEDASHDLTVDGEESDQRVVHRKKSAARNAIQRHQALALPDDAWATEEVWTELKDAIP